MLLSILNAFGWVVAHWRTVAVVLAAVIVLVASIALFRSCGPKPKLDEKEIQDSIKAIEEKNDTKLKEILANVDVREKQIDANLANAKNATVNAYADARKKYSNMNTADLAAEIEARK